MEGTGPVSGRPFPLGLVAGGRNPVALDRGLCIVLGIDPLQVPLLVAARRHGLAGTRSRELRYPLASPEDFQVDGFKVPKVLNPVRFSLARFARNGLKRLFFRFSRG